MGLTETGVKGLQPTLYLARYSAIY